MLATEQDLELIETVYSATTGDNTLSDAVKLFLHLQGERAAVLFHFDSIMTTASDLEIISPDEKLVQLAQSVFAAYERASGSLDNPLIAASFDRLLAGEVLLSDEVLPIAELRRTDYYKQVMEPLGVRRSMGWLAGGRGQHWLTFTSTYNEADEYLSSQVDRARLFQAHIGRAIHLLELLDDAGSGRKVFESAMQLMPYGIVLVDDRRRVLFHNARAQALLQRSRSLALRNGHFAVGATVHERSDFEKWWAMMVSCATTDGASYCGTSLDTVWEIETSRVAGLSDNTVSERRWMLTLKERPGESTLSCEELQQRFGLTPAEARVCVYLCSNGDAVSTARAMGLTPNTVRTHLKNSFSKTGTRNQVELAIAVVS